MLNWDQTGISVVPGSAWTMDLKGFNRVEIVHIDDKHQFTAVFCGSLDGDVSGTARVNALVGSSDTSSWLRAPPIASLGLQIPPCDFSIACRL